MVAGHVVDAVIGIQRIYHHVCWLVEGFGPMIVAAVLCIINLIGKGVFVAGNTLPILLTVVPAVRYPIVQLAVGGVVILMLQVGDERHIAFRTAYFLIDIESGDVVALLVGIETVITIGCVKYCLGVDMVHGLGGEDLCSGAHGCYTH